MSTRLPEAFLVLLIGSSPKSSFHLECQNLQKRFLPSLSHPLAVQLKSGPVIRIAESFVRMASECGLGAGQCRGWRKFILNHVAVETLHQLRSSFVIDLPEAGHHSLGTSEEKRARQAHGDFPRVVSSDGALAGAEDHQVTGEFHLVDVSG